MMEELTLHTQGSSSQPAVAAEKPALRAVESGGKYYVQQLLEVMRSDGTWSKVRGPPTARHHATPTAARQKLPARAGVPTPNVHSAARRAGDGD